LFVIIYSHSCCVAIGYIPKNTVTKYFHAKRITTLRLNFKGYQISRGHDEVKQVEDAAKFLLSNCNEAQKVLIVGYSYGSIIGASASFSIQECVGYVLIAPPFSVSHWLLLFNSSYHLKRAVEKENMTRLLLIGTHDNFTSKSAFLKAASKFPVGVATKVLSGLDHFFLGEEDRVISEIDEWIKQQENSIFS